MKNILSGVDVALIILWSILLMGSLFVTSDLLFGWPIQVHLTITGALIAFRILFKNRSTLKSN